MATEVIFVFSFVLGYDNHDINSSSGLLVNKISAFSNFILIYLQNLIQPV